MAPAPKRQLGLSQLRLYAESTNRWREKDLAITVLEARTRQNYQTHYIMTHAEPHFLFYEVILQLEGAETPGQALEWGKQNLELGYMDDIQELELARWTIVGEDIEYKAGENFEYQFVYIYKVPDKGNFEDYYLQVTGGQKIALGRVYEKEGKYSVRPTDDLALGPGANVVGEA